MADPLFQAILCADWAARAPGRAVCRANVISRELEVETPPPAGWDVAGVVALAQRLMRGGGPVLVGFDCPIGVPRSYLEAVRRSSTERASSGTFVEWLKDAAARPEFFVETSDVDDWGVDHPFFRVPPGKGSRGRWEGRLAGLGIRVLREIDRVTGAKPVFVVSGIPGSVGSAARDVWRGLLPYLEREPCPIALWPFDGTLADLAGRGGVVVGEIYPRLAYTIALSDAALGECRLTPLAKNDPEVRRDALERLRGAAWVGAHGIRLGAADEAEALRSGDAFDALMAAAGLLRCVLEGAPLSGGEDRVAEGGILGSGAVVLGRTQGDRIAN